MSVFRVKYKLRAPVFTCMHAYRHVCMYVYACEYARVCLCVHHGTYVEGRGQLERGVLLLPYVSPRNLTQVTGLGSKCSDMQFHLAELRTSL